MKAIDAVCAVLRDADGPLHYREIATRIIAKGLWDTEGKTPRQTVNALLGDDIRNHGSDSRFLREGPGRYSLNPNFEPDTPSIEDARRVDHQEADRFLVQVNRDGGFANIMRNRRYDNRRWMDKSLDGDHGEVKPGDELVIYCTTNVPNYGGSLAFSVIVKDVSPDNVSFELKEPEFFTSPLTRVKIHQLVSRGKLPAVFSKCGHQGFNIARLDNKSAKTVLDLLNGLLEFGSEVDVFSRSKVEDRPNYTVKSIIDDGCFLEEKRVVSILDRLKTKKNLILQGPPGTGKTWLAKKLAYALIGQKDEDKVRQVQFHPNLSYEDFVRGWRPQGDGTLGLVDGPFLEISEVARQDPNGTYVMVIEEINRGSPASIFGELLTLLEADKRTRDNGLTLAHQRTADESFYIPPNLYVIGTMNLADRSLALVDLALRRRFAFFDLEPVLDEAWRDWVHLQCEISTDFLVDISHRITSLNEQIAADLNLGHQFRIGHSFVVPKSGEPIAIPEEWFSQVVETEIAPLLSEYWFDDPDKVDEAKSQLLSGL